jgi:DNA polymerase III delta prime subunit
MWQTHGHTLAKKILTAQVRRWKFPHAYLFAGPSGVGKKTLAQELAGKILQTENLSTHPDFISYDPAVDEGMEGMRKFLARLGTKPFVGQHKIAVMDNMEQANVQMSNALLKTLEEPGESTILILLASHANLLPTITSRCQLISFSPLTLAELKSFAQDQGLATTEELLVSSFGAPARLQEIANDPAQAQEIMGKMKQLESAYVGAVSEKLLAVSHLAELEAEQLEKILLAWLYQQRQQLSGQPLRAKLMQQISVALIGLKKSLNKKMVLQKLVLSSHVL